MGASINGDKICRAKVTVLELSAREEKQVLRHCEDRLADAETFGETNEQER